MDDLSLRVYLENGSDAMRGGWLELPVVPERLDAFMRGVVGVDDGGGYAVVDHEPGWFGDVLGSDLESFSVSSLNLAARCVAHARDLAVADSVDGDVFLDMLATAAESEDVRFPSGIAALAARAGDVAEFWTEYSLPDSWRAGNSSPDELYGAHVAYGLTWTRSKPDLRMYREMFGMSTAEFGRLAAVDGRTVRAWENPREWVPDRTAWMAAESLWRDAERMASGLVPEAGEGPVVLPYGSGASTPACVASRIAAGRLSAAGRPWDASFPRPDGPDCGKARFRLMTDMLHLGGEKGSVLFGVTRQTVFAWRHPRMRDSVPSPAAFDAVGERWSAMVARASELAGMMSAAADRAAADGRRRMAPPLTFYRLRSDWEAWHGPDDGGWRSEDCSVWLAAVLLHDMGLEPSVVYAEADPEAMF